MDPAYDDNVSVSDPACPIRCQERRKKLCDDLPGLHTYVWACVCCQREFGPEWVERHHAMAFCTG